MAEDQKKVDLVGYVVSLGEAKTTEAGKPYRKVTLGCTDREYSIAVFGNLPADYKGKQTMTGVLVGEYRGNPSYMWYYRAPGQQAGGGKGLWKNYPKDYRVIALQCAANVFHGTGKFAAVIDSAELYHMWLSKSGGLAPAKDEPKQPEPAQEGEPPADNNNDIPF